MRNDLTAVLQQAHFLSVMCDAATDVAVIEQQIVYIRYLENGIARNKYLALEAVQHANAEGLLNAINKAFERAEVCDWKRKLVGSGTDGASVMRGHRTGVVARMKVEISHLVDIHCVAHKLELGILDAIKHDRELEKAKELLQGIYRHYHFSTKAVRELKEIAAALEETVKKPVNILGTRWSQLYMKGSDSPFKP